MRKLGFEVSKDETPAFKDAEMLAMMVRDLTGDWFVEIKCDDIYDKNRRYHDQIIYFGPKQDLEEGGGATLMNQLSMMDRYNFDE